MIRIRFYIGGIDSTRTTHVLDSAWAAIEAKLTNKWQGFTRYDAVGSWQGQQEPTRVYEILTATPPSQARMMQMAQDLGALASQEAVLYSQEQVIGRFVQTPNPRGV